MVDWHSEGICHESATRRGGTLRVPVATAAANSVSGRSVLVVDDDPTILATVADALDLEGFPVVTATNGQEALDALDRTDFAKRPCLVLLDMRMPVLDGWGFMSALRERKLSLSVVVMTAASDARRWAREIEANGVLAKPFELDELISAVNRFCSGDACGSN